eukprot:TRINITY_DN45401_c0_g1_i3.p1 TRINITY_DN45401_c0_g1~~TRINITY_DN45401_c0_g1_i3.p1  ORF type:complete len:168 (+),score=16.48 TRINITY_DN45401_c0_g1_i3:66-569(+)
MLSMEPGCRKRVLVLGGWSPGPLRVIESRTNAAVEFIEPNIPMPPMGCRWCLNPFLLFLLLYLFYVMPWLLEMAGSWTDGVGGVILQAAFLLISLFLVRMLVAGLVWFSMRDGCRICASQIEEYEPDVLVGFSFGGGVALQLLASGRWRGPTLLLAPTAARLQLQRL